MSSAVSTRTTRTALSSSNARARSRSRASCSFWSPRSRLSRSTSALASARTACEGPGPRRRMSLSSSSSGGEAGRGGGGGVSGSSSGSPPPIMLLGMCGRSYRSSSSASKSSIARASFTDQIGPPAALTSPAIRSVHAARRTASMLCLIWRSASASRSRDFSSSASRFASRGRSVFLSPPDEKYSLAEA